MFNYKNHYNVGDIVRVKEGLSPFNYTGPYGFNPKMKKYTGKLMKVRYASRHGVYGHSYSLNELDSGEVTGWVWHDEMLDLSFNNKAVEFLKFIKGLV